MPSKQEQGQRREPGQASTAVPADRENAGEAGVAGKSHSCYDARELLKLVDREHPKLSDSRQCAMLDIPRSALVCRTTPVRESGMQTMARIDALYLDDPCSGSRRIVNYLAREGIPIRHDRVRTSGVWDYKHVIRSHAPMFQEIRRSHSPV